jgi:hypothetical protein
MAENWSWLRREVPGNRRHQERSFWGLSLLVKVLRELIPNLFSKALLPTVQERNEQKIRDRIGSSTVFRVAAPDAGGLMRPIFCSKRDRKCA